MIQVSKLACRAACAALVLLLCLFVLNEAALAHASLIASTPSDAAVLQSSPSSVSLRFSEPVTPLVARLIHPDGRTEILKDDGGQGATITYALPANLEHGTHILSWRVTSADGHPVGGGQLFSIGAPSVTGGAVGSQGDPQVLAGIWAARLLLMTGLIFGLGSTVFARLAVIGLGRGAARLVTGAILGGLAAAPVLIGFQGLDALGEPIGSLRHADVWAAGLWSTSYGPATLIAVAALLLALLGRFSHSHGIRWLPAIMLLLAAAAFASAGHASTAPPRWLTTAAIFLHAVSVILWIGALIPLADVLRVPGDAAAGALRRFSAAISPIILVLVASGFALAIVQVQHLPALWTTRYGMVLAIKLGLVLVVFIVAAFNRYRLSARAMSGKQAASIHLRRTICAEMLLALVILGILGLWRFTPPPRELSSAAPPVQSIVMAADGLTARLTLRPAIVGPVTVDIDDIELDGKPFNPTTITLELSKPAYGIGPFTHDAVSSGGGHFTVQGNFLPIDGFWVAKLTVLVSDFRAIIATDIFDVSKPATPNAR